MASRARQVALLWLLAVLSRGRAEAPLPRITQVDIRGASRMGDTHAVRLSGRLGLATPHNVEKKYADKIERELLDVVARKDRTLFSHVVGAHGRAVCTARKPMCLVCAIRALCPYPDKTAS